MKFPPLQRRTLALVVIIIPLLLLFIYVALRSGPLAPIAATVSTVESRSVAPALAGIGTVQARFTYKIGPTVAGRVKRLDVHVGDIVKAGQVLGEMDAVDLDDRVSAQQAAIKSSEAALRQAAAKETFAQTQATRYEQLLSVRGTSEETVVTKRQELAVASAALVASREDIARLRAELEALRAQRGNLRLVAPNLPPHDVPDGHTEVSWLRELTALGAAERYGPPSANPKAYQQIERELHFGTARIRDTVTLEHHEWVRFESAANAEHAGGKLIIRLEEPEAMRLYLRFTYETTLSEGMEEEEGVQVSEFVKSAYRASDLDTVRVIRMIATTGRPQ